MSYVLIDEYRRIRSILEECMKLENEEDPSLLHKECIEKLRELGLICGDDYGIISDPYYDKDCVAFVLKVLRRIFKQAGTSE